MKFVKMYLFLCAYFISALALIGGVGYVGKELQQPVLAMLLGATGAPLIAVSFLYLTFKS